MHGKTHNSVERLAIRDGRIIDPANEFDEVADLFIDSGKVISVGEPPTTGWIPAVQIDARNKIVCPGLVDLCAHLREPGQEQKANIQSETYAAAAASAWPGDHMSSQILMDRGMESSFMMGVSLPGLK